MHALSAGETLVAHRVGTAQHAHLLGDHLVDDGPRDGQFAAVLVLAHAGRLDGELALLVNEHDVAAVGLEHAEDHLQRALQELFDVENGADLGDVVVEDSQTADGGRARLGGGNDDRILVAGDGGDDGRVDEPAVLVNVHGRRQRLASAAEDQQRCCRCGSGRPASAAPGPAHLDAVEVRAVGGPHVLQQPFVVAVDHLRGGGKRCCRSVRPPRSAAR